MSSQVDSATRKPIDDGKNRDCHLFMSGVAYRFAQT